MIEETKHRIPKKAFDQEYATQWRREVEYLYTKNIKPTFTKRDKEYGIVTYKYKKTKALFDALYEFYEAVENEKAAPVETINKNELATILDALIKQGKIKITTGDSPTKDVLDKIFFGRV